MESQYTDLGALGERIREGTFDDWSMLERSRLGPCLVKAYTGKYESAGEVLEDFRAALAACGRELSSNADDEMDGLDWAASFSVVEDGVHLKLRLSDTASSSGGELIEPP